MRRLALSLALACLVVLAGCAVPSLNDVPERPDTPVNAKPATDQPAQSSTETQSGGTAAPRTNPWGDDPIVVGVDAPNQNRNYAAFVREATAYWEQNAEQYAGYDVDYEVRPDAESPDLVVEFVDEVPECGDAHVAVGCAPLITDARQISRPEPVYIQTGLSDSSTALVIQHELGHTLGLTHSDDPREVMRSESILYTQPQPNATERVFPWDDPEFTVYVDYANVSNRPATEDQIRNAFGYFADGADGTAPSNLTFRYVDSPDEADVVVGFSQNSPCGEGAASCSRTFGPDPDGDGVIETYAKLRITLVNLDTPAVGWHVARWFAYGLGAEEAAERPPPLRDADYEERRSEWWT